MCKACDKSFCLSNSSNEHYLQHPGLSVQDNHCKSNIISDKKLFGAGYGYTGSTMQGKWDKDNINFEVRPWLHNSSSNMLAVSYYEECAMSTWQDLQNMENMPCQHEMTRKAFLNHPWNYLYKIGNLEARFYRDEVGRPVFTIEWYLDCAHPVWGKNISKSETKLEALQTQFSILYYTGSFS